MDAFDIKLLNLLQTDNRRTAEDLAKSVGLSPAACQRRVKRLRDDGAFAAEIGVLSPDMTGSRMTVLAQIVLARGGAAGIDAFKRDMQRVPEVQQCYYTTGEFDFLLIITARDIGEYEQLTRRLFFENRHIQRFTTSVVMDTVKLGLQIPL